MSFDTVNSSYQGARNISNAQKRELLWNILEPGDPYDIKKSLIAKLPGDRKLFMGDSLEIVCLFQAAEIERLIENLDEYKLKYKEIERRQLDRHSYEIQIKELAQQLSETDGIRNENMRLKEFIRKQNLEMEEMKKRMADIDVNLQKKYDNALNQIETMYAENNMLKAQNSNLRNEVMSWRSRLQALDKARIKELEELRGAMDVQRRSQIDREMRELTARYNMERTQMEAEIRRLREMMEAKTRELDQWRSKASSLEIRINELMSKTGQNIQMQNRIAELENKLALFSQEIERLNLQLKDRNNEILELSTRYKRADQQIQKKDTELRDHFRRSGALEMETEKLKQLLAQLQGSAGKNQDLQGKLVKMSEQIERLNEVLRINTNEKMETASRLNRLEFEYESLRKNSSNDISSVKTQYESRIGLLNQEIERLGQENRNTMTKYSRLEAEASRLGELDRLTRTNTELQGTITRLNTQIVEFRRQLTVSSQETTTLRRRLQEGGDSSRRISELQALVANLRAENERLLDAARKFEFEGNSKITVLTRKEEEYRRTISEFELRLQQVIAENDSLKRIAEESAINRAAVLEQKLAAANREVDELRRQNEELRRKVQELGQNSELERRITKFSTEIERLNGILKVKVDEAANWEAKYRQIASERDELNRMAHELQRRLQESGSLAQRVAESDNKIASLMQEIDRLNVALRTKLDEYSSIEVRVRQITTERDELVRAAADQQRRLAESADVRMASLSAEIERLNNAMQRLNSELNDYKTRHNQAAEENGGLKRKIQELQLKQDTEVKTRISTYEQKILVFTQETDQLKRRIAELEASSRYLVDLENKAALMSQEIERLNRNLVTVVQENEDHRRKIAELENASRKSIELQSRVTILTQENERLVQTIEQRTRQFSGLTQKLGDVDVLTRNMNLLQERVNTLVNENRALVEQLRQAKEGLRTATGQTSRMSQQSDQLRRRIQELENANRRMMEYESKISSQGMEIERLTSQLRQSAELQNQLLVVSREKETLIVEVQKMQEAVRQGSIQSTRYVSEYKDLQNTLSNFRSENEQLKRRLIELNDSTRRLHEYESKFVILTQDNDRLNQLVETRAREVTTLNQKLVDLDAVGRTMRDLQDRVNKLTAENKHIMDEYNLLQENARNSANQGNRALQELNDLKSRASLVVQQNEQLKRRVMELEAAYQQMSNIENRASQLSIEIERLNGVLREKVNEIGGYQRELNEYKLKLPQLVEENNSMKMRFQEMGQQFESEFRTQISTMEKKYSVLSQETEQLRRRNNDLEVSSRKVVEYQSRLTMLQPEIERMNGNMQLVTSELTEYKTKFSQLVEENTSLKRRVQETTQQANNRLGQMGQETDQLKRRIIELENANRTISDMENRIAMLSNEISRLNQVLRQKLAEMQDSEGSKQKLTMELNEFRQRYPGLASENEQLRRRFTEMGQKFEQEMASRTSLYEQRITTLSREMEEARRKLGDNEGLSRRVAEYENRIGIMTQEIERLNMRLAEKVEQINRLDAEWTAKYKQLEGAAFESEQRLGKYVQEIERLNLLLRQKVELESRSAQLIQEIERLNNTLRIKVQESQEWQEKHNMVMVEYERLQNAYNQLVRDAELSKRQRIEHEQKFAKITTEFEKLHKIINDLKEENYRLKVELGKQDFQSLVDKNHFLAGEIDRLNAIIQQLNQELSELRIRFTDETSLHKRIQEHLALFVVLFAEIESLRKRVKDKEKEVEEVRRTSLAPYRV